MLTSARGKTHLLDSNNHRYRCDGEYQGNKHWRCLKAGCKSRVHTDPNLNIIHQVNAFNHSHLADARDVETAELNALIRHKAVTTNHAPQDILGEALEELGMDKESMAHLKRTDHHILHGIFH